MFLNFSASTPPEINNGISTKGLLIARAIDQNRIMYEHPTNSASYMNSQPMLKLGWGKAKQQKLVPLSDGIKSKLQGWFERGKANTAVRVSPDLAHNMLLKDILLKDWKMRLNCSPERIKMFFSLAAAKNKSKKKKSTKRNDEMIDSGESDIDDYQFEKDVLEDRRLEDVEHLEAEFISQLD